MAGISLRPLGKGKAWHQLGRKKALNVGSPCSLCSSLLPFFQQITASPAPVLGVGRGEARPGPRSRELRSHWPPGLSRKTIPLAGHWDICPLSSPRPSGPGPLAGTPTWASGREGARVGILCTEDIALHLSRLPGYLGPLSHWSYFPRKLTFLETLPFSWLLSGLLR